MRCNPDGNEFQIAVAQDVSARLSKDDPPIVDSVSFGKFDGLSFTWQKYSAPNPKEVTVVKNGKSYKISGRVEGTPNPPGVHNVKNFDLDVTCP